MRVASVSYGFTQNLGNFQSRRVDTTVELGDSADDSFDQALLLAESITHEALDDKKLSDDEREALRKYRDQETTLRARFSHE